MLEIKYSGLNKIINQANRYYSKVIVANDEIAENARDIIISRVSKGNTTDGRKMAYKNANDNFWGGKGKSKRVGDYSAAYVDTRFDHSKGSQPMDYNLTGGLYKAFTYRKSRSKVYTVKFFINNSKSIAHKKNYITIHDYLVNRFGPVFMPSKSETIRIAKKWKSKL